MTVANSSGCLLASPRQELQAGASALKWHGILGVDQLCSVSLPLKKAAFTLELSPALRSFPTRIVLSDSAVRDQNTDHRMPKVSRAAAVAVACCKAPYSLR